MAPFAIAILFSAHSTMRLKQRVPAGHGFEKGGYVRLMLVRQQHRALRPLWMVRVPDGVLLGSLWCNRKGKHRFVVRTALDLPTVRLRQRQGSRQFIPIEARLFRIAAIGVLAKVPPMKQDTLRQPFAFSVAKLDHIYAVCPTLAAAVAMARERFSAPTMVISIEAWFSDGTRQQIPDEAVRTSDGEWIPVERCRELQSTLFGSRSVRMQVTELLRRNEGADYWEKLVLRMAEAFLAHVDEQLRGIPIAEAGVEPMTLEDFENLPDIELHSGIPSAKHWRLYEEGRRRLGFASVNEEFFLLASKSREEVEAEYQRRRAALRGRPFAPSQIPFPSGIPED